MLPINDDLDEALELALDAVRRARRQTVRRVEKAHAPTFAERRAEARPFSTTAQLRSLAPQKTASAGTAARASTHWAMVLTPKPVASPALPFQTGPAMST